MLLTVGRELDPGALPPHRGNVHVEPWVPQQDVLVHGAAAVVHGGSGSTLGAVAVGVPLVVIPLFADQPENARRVPEVGAGIAVEPDREDTRRLWRAARGDRDGPRGARFRGRAGPLASELRANRPVDEAVPLFKRLGRG